jgi:hypothetical protein
MFWLHYSLLYQKTDLEGRGINRGEESIYRTLRELLKQEVINKAQKKYSLNRNWIQRMHEFSLQHTIKPHTVDAHSILQFSDGDSITYEFKSADLMGIYWGHMYDYVTDVHPSDIPIIIYHPHEWLIHARKTSEEYVLNRVNKEKRLVLFSIGGNTDLDKKFQKDWSSDYLKINTYVEVTGLKSNRYINVLGNFIFEVRTTVAFEEAVDNFFQKNSTINETNRKELQQIVHDHYRTKLIFSRNRKRAQSLRKNLSKDFYIPSNFKS